MSTDAKQPWAEALAFAAAHEVPWPRDPHEAPERFGVHHEDPPPFNRLRGPLHARGPCSGVIWQHGREVACWGQPQRADQTFSVAKTYLALLVGVAQQRGLLADLHAPVAGTLPGIGFDSAHNRPITWAMLLNQTSEWEGQCLGLPDTVDRWRKVAQDPRPSGGPKGGARPLQPPGSYWEYNDVRINQLSLALLHLFGRPLPELFRECLLEPLDAQDDFAWEGYDDAWVPLGGARVKSVPGGTHWGGGVRISARDQARIGQLLLDGGVHQGAALLPPDFLRFMRQPCAQAVFYGGLVWLNPQGQAFPGASEEAFCMVGAGGHLCWVDPPLRAVVVARWLDPAHTGGFTERLAMPLRAQA